MARAKRVVTAADVYAAADAGQQQLAVPPGCVVTPLAVDAARERAVTLTRHEQQPAAPEPGAARAGPSGVVHISAHDVGELPLFPYPGPGPDQTVRAKDVVTGEQGAPMAAGFLTLTRGTFPWTLSYDEIQYVIEGELHIGTPGGTVVGRPGDVIYVPRGSAITFGTPTWARFLYVTYPADWESAGRAGGTAASAAHTMAPDPGPPARGSDWDRPSVFPVVLEGEVPCCDRCLTPVRSKPDVLTQLSATRYAAKTHPRIRLRGRIDSLQALALMAAARAGAVGKQVLQEELGTVAAYCRELISAEYHERDAALPALPGLDAERLHAATHDPRGHFGIDHLTPGTTDPELLHWLNLLRCQVREVEVCAFEALGSTPPWAASIERGLNRLSSLMYYLELQLMAGRRTP